MRSESYVQMSVTKVIKACEKAIEHNEQCFINELKGYTEHYENKKKWFGLGRKLTKNEAFYEVYEKKRGVCNGLTIKEWQEERLYYDKKKFEELMWMTVTSDDGTVWISSSDHKLIKEFLDNEQ